MCAAHGATHWGGHGQKSSCITVGLHSRRREMECQMEGLIVPPPVVSGRSGGEQHREGVRAGHHCYGQACKRISGRAEWV